MRAYHEAYLHGATETFGSMVDYAVNGCKLDGDDFLSMFIAAGIALQFERGNPVVIAGMSGADLAAKAIKIVTGEPPAVDYAEPHGFRTEEFWAGWILARYQWRTVRSFAVILGALPFASIVGRYHPLHEAPESKFFAVADRIIAERNPQTNLRRLRENVGVSQAGLAEQAAVSLRSVQMYEQRNKNVNHAQAITLAKIARVLGCEVEDLLEREPDED
ncbi:MAG: helix-turn-helix transcriptional regulator [Coriobacteriales bacterium]|jgi:DNA-binding Xre family transcriptional regulator|nr:helix-turn-helix transcriptional regulator [Coriobacteriales bacterium]